MILRQKVQMTNEIKKQAIISELKNLGIFEYKGKNIDDCDYYEAKHALSVARAARD